MAQIDMNKLRTDAQNSTELKESSEIAQVETPSEPVELTNNATEGQEDINEVAQTETEEADEETMAIVRYVGNGIWKDSHNALWANKDNGATIKHERKYTKDEYKERIDLRFMVTYGAMTVTFV